MQLDTTQIFIYGTAWSAIWGLIVWFGKDRITAHRDSRSHKRQFRVSLRTWQAGCDVSELDRVSLAYEAGKKHFIAETEAVRDYIKDKNRFDVLCNNVRTRGHNAGQSQKNRGEFIDSIEELIASLE